MTAAVDLVALFSAQIHQTHVATAACPLPPVPAPLTWISAANGAFLRGVNPSRQVLVQINHHGSDLSDVELQPGVVWPGYGSRLPGRLLGRVLHHARGAVDRQGRPVEQQYWITDLGRGLTVIRPPQLATAVTVITPRMDLPILCDVHSHHAMGSYFSGTDDRDDALSIGVSAVIGTIFTTPTIGVRLTVYGHVQDVPATLIFSDLGPFRDAFAGGTHELP
ncbi:MAG: hypothetical protein CYG59_00010 [Chloroflexi bacterium]|nr:MAG: hypothetical protein CYG59_00010 [Chloroflexota bacterium]